MKRIIGLALTLMYLFTSSSLVHASTMGFFDEKNTSEHTTNHCHGDTSRTSDTDSKQDMGCCELFSSHQYKGIRIDFAESVKFLQNNDNQANPIYKSIHTAPQIIHRHSMAFSPGGQTSWGKYHKFSDLVGVIVKVI